MILSLRWSAVRSSSPRSAVRSASWRRNAAMICWGSAELLSVRVFIGGPSAGRAMARSYIDHPFRQPVSVPASDRDRCQGVKGGYRRKGIIGPAAGHHASRYQSLRFQKVLSQPLNVALSFLEIADTCGRHTTGMTTPSLTTMSFMAMNKAARFTGSSSLSAA